MKSYGNLFERIVSEDNITEALHKAAKGKRNKRAVRYAIAHEEEIVAQIRESLISGKWSPPDVHVGHQINDGVNMKKRVIVCPEFVNEQVVHHALLQVIGPLFMRSFYRWSCGSVDGRGLEEMERYIGKYLKKNVKAGKKLYFAIGDISKCFDSIDAIAAYNIIARKIRCSKTLEIVAKILNSNAVMMPDGSLRKGGVPIGLYTSPWIANIVLDHTDHIFKDKHAIGMLTRFMDDDLMFDTNKRRLKKAIEEVTLALAKVGLKWKNYPEVKKFNSPIEYCGMKIYPDGRICLRPKIYLRGKRVASRVGRKKAAGRKITWYDAARMNSISCRFREFGCYKAFATDVLPRTGMSMRKFREIISKHDKLKAMERKIGKLKIERKGDNHAVYCN